LPDSPLQRTRRFEKRREDILYWLQGITEDETETEEDEEPEVSDTEEELATALEVTDLDWREEQFRDWVRDCHIELSRRE
jgi:hypothetical protein